MGDRSAIEWTEATWNPVTGCSKVSPGCAHCYAEAISLRFGRSSKPWTPANTTENVALHPERLEQPLRWRRPRMIFVNSMSDLFHDEIPYEFVREVFDVMRGCDGRVLAATGRPNPTHTFQVLTKRPEQALALWAGRKLGFDRWPENIWLGVSIENARYTWRADVLREIPAAVRFISAEPLLGSLFQVTLAREEDGKKTPLLEDGASAPHTRARESEAGVWSSFAASARRKPLDLSKIDWLIVGGESGSRARPMRLEWARELRDACAAAGVAFFFKQHGGRTAKAGGRELDGRTWDELPRVA